MQGKYTEAIPLLEENVAQSIEKRDRRNAISSSCLLAQIYIHLKNYERAQQLLVKAKSIFDAAGFNRIYTLSETLYSTLAKFYAAKGNLSLAYAYADSALTASDSASAVKIRANLIEAREKADFLQQKFEQERLRSERQRQVFFRNSLIVIIILLAIIGLLFINRQRLNRKKLEAQLDAATSKLISYSQTLDEKEELIEHINEQMEQLKKEELEMEELGIRNQLERSVLVTDEQWDDFCKLFEKVHKGFFNNLKKKIPDLSPAELRFLTLTKLKLSVKDMAAMLGVSPGTIRIYRFRLRKKLKLEKDEMIEEIVDSI